MIAIILFCALIVTLGQFGFYYWRTKVMSVSALPVSDRVRAAAGIAATSLGSHDFRAILGVYDSVPHLGGSVGRFRAIRAYYAVVEKIGRLVPSVAKWSEVEMICCSRYVAVLLERHLERNLATAAQLVVI
jgi:hypothetical protein